MTRDIERTIEFEFVRATENAALVASLHWLGRGNKEAADGAACDAIYGVMGMVDICGECMIGEGIKDNAPGIFMGDKLGSWKEGSPRFEIALDPIDGTSNIAKGLPNSISVIGATLVLDGKPGIKNLPGFYSEKLSYGPKVIEYMHKLGVNHIKLDNSVEDTLPLIAASLGKRVSELVIVTLDRPRNQHIIDQVRAVGASLRMVSDGDITAAVAPSLPDSGVDLYWGIGGTPEAILTAIGLKCLGGNIQTRMWFRNEAEKKEQCTGMSEADIKKTYHVNDLVPCDSAIFCATGISDSPLLPGVKFIGRTARTKSILMRAKSKTVRYIEAVHDLEHKRIPMGRDNGYHHI
ncbi:MAG: fructose-bisphosphatase class II family protein [Verrucomicrobiota bacterium]